MNECQYCKNEKEPNVAHYCREEDATRFAVLQRLASNVFFELEKYRASESFLMLDESQQEALAPLFDKIETMKGGHGAAAAKEVLERIDFSIAFADAALWLSEVGDDEHKPIYDEAKIKWARYKAENDCPRYPVGKVKDEMEMCNRLLKETGEKSSYSTKDMADVMRRLRERLLKLTTAAASLFKFVPGKEMQKLWETGDAFQCFGCGVVKIFDELADQNIQPDKEVCKQCVEQLPGSDVYVGSGD